MDGSIWHRIGTTGWFNENNTFRFIAGCSLINWAIKELRERLRYMELIN
jgi:hypothetical protein